MANIKISDLTPAAAVLGTQEFEVNDSLTSKKVTAAQMLAYIQANAGAVDLTSTQTITGVKTFTQTIVGSVNGTAGNVTGTVAGANGGTGATTLTANNVLLGNGTSAVQAVAPGTTGNVLTSNGTTWQSTAPPSATIASTAEAEAGTNNTNFITPLRMREGFNASGSAPVYACRAWVNFNGTTSPGTIRASGNVSSVTRNATGDYTVNFTTAMPDANYCGLISTNEGERSATIGVRRTLTGVDSGSLRVQTYLGTTGFILANQTTNMNVAIFR